MTPFISEMIEDYHLSNQNSNNIPCRVHVKEGSIA